MLVSKMRFVVSIHPRLFRRGNKTVLTSRSNVSCFNPPPPFQARERGDTLAAVDKYGFQSTPAFSGEGTMPGHRYKIKRLVSIHPRLFRRGNLRVRIFYKVNISFQSTPAFSGEGTRKTATVKTNTEVSIHPRLFRRGNTSFLVLSLYGNCFNPPPPFQAREQNSSDLTDRATGFNPPPPFQAREHNS